MDNKKIDTKTNSWKPMTARLSKIVPQSSFEKLYSIELENPNEKKQFTWMPGQFLELSVFGIGEAPFSISSSPTSGTLEICVRATGSITNALEKMKEGEKVGIRGPFGNSFVVPEAKGKNLVLVAGGIGLVPLRSMINYVLDKREEFKEVFIFYGTRDPTQILFQDEIEQWQKRNDIQFMLTVDRGSPDAGFGEPDPSGKYQGNVGVVTTLFSKIDIPSKNTMGFIVGPPVMFKFVVKEFEKLQIKPSNIIVSLERVMHCGIGKCAHCQIGDILVCRDGPIFTYEQVQSMPDAI
ncbi:FAD/NAD(P)-binding protein [Promethearchaeum syntrophicum]|uniref:FAD/NAD(P)-binding protein n=1 Tax=Promethearchaeum syntrophicum TaxID=2594042 RepID=A0A5B9DDR3_9ARCH|nr:FAD/NAD(P)-binding protein [Candidatus Prometheoarchaeum syntrophicum]QEE17388.1 Sulfhydrogenase 2 subunit gamma [Candidatus Prometheoarchaeum syntrophicum]